MAKALVIGCLVLAALAAISSAQFILSPILTAQAAPISISFDSQSYVGYSASGTLTNSGSITIGSGTNRAVIASCWLQGTLNSATFNGNAMTTLASQAVTAPYAATLLFLIAYAPTTGTATGNMVFTFSGASSQLICWEESVAGVKQSAQPDASHFTSGTTIAGGGGANAYAPATITTASAGAWVITIFGGASGGNSINTQPSPSAGGTYRASDAFAINFFWDSGSPAGAAGTYTLNGGLTGIGLTFQAFSISLAHA